MILKLDPLTRGFADGFAHGYLVDFAPSPEPLGQVVADFVSEYVVVIADASPAPIPHSHLMPHHGAACVALAITLPMVAALGWACARWLRTPRTVANVPACETVSIRVDPIGVVAKGHAAPARRES